MKDRDAPCVYYICAHQPCSKGVKDVTLKKCKNCNKYKGRKATSKSISIKSRRQKDIDRHDNWKHRDKEDY